jgi:hypothetical protein
MRFIYVFEEFATYYLAINIILDDKGFALLTVHFFLLQPIRNYTLKKIFLSPFSPKSLEFLKVFIN